MADEAEEPDGFRVTAQISVTGRRRVEDGEVVESASVTSALGVSPTSASEEGKSRVGFHIPMLWWWEDPEPGRDLDVAAQHALDVLEQAPALAELQSVRGLEVFVGLDMLMAVDLAEAPSKPWYVAMWAVPANPRLEPVTLHRLAKVGVGFWMAVKPWIDERISHS